MKVTDHIALPQQWLHDPIPVLVAGAGGTGSEIMDRLFKLHMCYTF